MKEFDEAAFEIQKRRRKRAVKVVFIEGMMVMAVIALVIITTFIAIGYNVNPRDDWAIERVGLVQIQSKPTGANLVIDGDAIFGWTNLSRSMTEGEHEIVLSKDGYDSWQKKVFVMAGLYRRLDYARLFLTERKVEKKVDIAEGYKVSFSKEGDMALEYSPVFDEDMSWKILEINGDEIKTREVDVSKLFAEDAEGLEEIEIRAWSRGGERVIATRGEEWFVIDLKKPENSLNLTEKFGVFIDDFRVASDSANEIFVVSRGDLRLVNVSEEKISGILVKNVREFDVVKNDVIYLADSDGDGDDELGIYQRGEKAGKEFSLPIELENGEKVEPSMVRAKEYYGGVYVSLASREGDFAVFRGGNLESFMGTEEVERVFYEQFLGEEIKDVDVRGDGELVVIDFGEKIGIFDIETENVVKITTFLGAKWLDEYMIYDIDEEGKLVVMDFDRSNEREMTDLALFGTEVKISKNNRWMYFVSKNNELSRVIIAD